MSSMEQTSSLEEMHILLLVSMQQQHHQQHRNQQQQHHQRQQQMVCHIKIKDYANFDMFSYIDNWGIEVR